MITKRVEENSNNIYFDETVILEVALSSCSPHFTISVERSDRAQIAVISPVLRFTDTFLL